MEENIFDMDVAIVGGGLFGTTIATTVAGIEAVESVDVYEKLDDILQCASAINQCRLHRGYHYPRSRETAIESLEAAPAFRDEYPSAVIDERNHYYGIAKEGSKTTGSEFIKHCEDVGLEYKRASIDAMRDDALDLCVEVEENQIDPRALRAEIHRRIDESETINLHLNHEVEDADELDGYEYVIVATYTSNNPVLSSYPTLQQEYKFEVVERPVAELPEKFENKSCIVLDGPFINIEPFSDTGYHHLGHVVHGERHSNVGETPELGDLDPSLLNAGLIEDPPSSRFQESVEGGLEFFPNLDEAEYVGSKFTIRTVLPDVEDTDARPTIVDREGNVFSVFSGKMSTCVVAANKVAEQLRNEQ